VLAIYFCKSVIPIELVTVDVLARLLRASPFEGDGSSRHVNSPQAGRLAWNSVLRLDLNGRRKWTTSNARLCLNPDRVDGVRSEVTYCRQKVVIHDLGVPGCDRQSRICCVKYFVTLKEIVRSEYKKSTTIREENNSQ